MGRQRSTRRWGHVVRTPRSGVRRLGIRSGGDRISGDRNGDDLNGDDWNGGDERRTGRFPDVPSPAEVTFAGPSPDVSGDRDPLTSPIERADLLTATLRLVGPG